MKNSILTTRLYINVLFYSFIAIAVKVPKNYGCFYNLGCMAIPQYRIKLTTAESLWLSAE